MWHVIIMRLEGYYVAIYASPTIAKDDYLKGEQQVDDGLAVAAYLYDPDRQLHDSWTVEELNRRRRH